MGNPHVIAIPYPAQGHVIPLLELSQWLVKHGMKVTFVNTDFNHQRVMKAESGTIHEVVTMVSIPDGLEAWENRNELGRLTEAIFSVMPGHLEALIESMHEKGESVACVIADWGMGWAFEVAHKMGLHGAAFWPGPAAVLALSFNIPKLLEDGIVDSNGRALKDEMIRLSPGMPVMDSRNSIWASIGDEATQKIVFDVLLKDNQCVKLVDWIICNSCYDLEPGAFALFPNILPVGPLLAANRLGKSAGCFWAEDSACLAWLDQQAADSVVYIAFGSFTVFDQTQFEELALGLELSNRPFLWVVREDTTANTEKAYPQGFKERVERRGRMVSWAPQQQVLSHPSIACFVSHCGWNSTIEGISNGVPFICWPYFADQFLNETYICDKWKVGLGLSKDESGIIRRGEIKEKVGLILSDKSYKERALDLQEKVMLSVKGGSSYQNFSNFVNWIKDNYNNSL